MKLVDQNKNNKTNGISDSKKIIEINSTKLEREKQGSLYFFRYTLFNNFSANLNTTMNSNLSSGNYSVQFTPIFNGAGYKPVSGQFEVFGSVNDDVLPTTRVESSVTLSGLTLGEFLFGTTEKSGILNSTDFIEPTVMMTGFHASSFNPTDDPTTGFVTKAVTDSIKNLGESTTISMKNKSRSNTIIFEAEKISTTENGINNFEEFTTAGFINFVEVTTAMMETTKVIGSVVVEAEEDSLNNEIVESDRTVDAVKKVNKGEPDTITLVFVVLGVIAGIGVVLLVVYGIFKCFNKRFE